MDLRQRARRWHRLLARIDARHAKHETSPRCLVRRIQRHELDQLGIEIYAERRPDLIKHSRAWIHFGANIGAAHDPGKLMQASDEEMENIMAKGIASAGLAFDRRVPAGTISGGEAGVVHRGGGRYMSIIGRNGLFHNPADHGS